MQAVNLHLSPSSASLCSRRFMGKFCSARVNPKCAQHAIDKRNIKRLFIKEEIFIVKNSKHTCVLKAIFPKEKKRKFCCCYWICCEDSKYVVLKIRQSSSSWRIGFLSVLASRSYHAARSTPCTSPRRGWAGFPGPQWPRKKRIWLAGSLSWSGWPALYHWSVGLSEIGTEGQKVQKLKLVTFFLL